jgi:hypothetical protein
VGAWGGFAESLTALEFRPDLSISKHGTPPSARRADPSLPCNSEEYRNAAGRNRPELTVAASHYF